MEVRTYSKGSQQAAADEGFKKVATSGTDNTFLKEINKKFRFQEKTRFRQEIFKEITKERWKVFLTST